MFLSFSIIGVVVPLFNYHINFGASIDASIMNGLIAVIAILFGFVTIEARANENQSVKFVFFIPLIMFLLITSGAYFSDVMYYGYPTKRDLLIAMVNLYYNAFSFAIAFRIDRYG
jgi:uncharacterized membrane protein